MSPVTTTSGRPTIAVIVPCYDEEVAVTAVVRDLRAALPGATVYVYDNNSTDATAALAAQAGAVVRSELRAGKGNVVRRAFADVDADVYLMIDGDSTYDAAAAPQLVEALLAGPHDMVVGTRVPEEDEAYRPGHELGNRAFNLLVSTVFGGSVTDMLSGYRAFSRRFAKTFPAASTHFAIETELTIHAISHRMPVAEVPVGFRDRPEGSESKLSTVKDGLDILRTIGGLLHHERPLWVYPGLAGLLLSGGLLVGPDRLGLVLTTLGAALVLAGMLLQGAARGRREQLRSSYLAIAPPQHAFTEAAEEVVREAGAIAEIAAEVAAGIAGETVEPVTPVAPVAPVVEPVLVADEPAGRVVQLRHRPAQVVPPAAGQG